MSVCSLLGQVRENMRLHAVCAVTRDFSFLSRGESYGAPIGNVSIACRFYTFL
jgi:hypothetical protein